MRTDLAGIPSPSHARLPRISASAGHRGGFPKAMMNLPLPDGALQARIRASGGTGDPKAILAQMQADVAAFMERHRGDVNGMQAAVDQIYSKLNAMGVSPGSAGGDLPQDPGYSAPFATYFRSGHSEEAVQAANKVGERGQVMAAMSGGTDSAGGYLAPVEWDRKVLQALRTVSPLRRLCDVVTTKTRGYVTIWSDAQWGSGWVGETASRPNTTTPTLAPIGFMPGELYANPSITQQLLDDADFNVETWLANELAITFALQEGIAFVSGNGQNKPVGFLTYVTGAANAALHPGGPITTVPSGAANSLTPDGLLDLVYDLAAPYRQGSAFLMSSITANMVAKLKDGQGNYIWRQALTVDQPSTLLGYEVAIDENMPAPVAGNTPVAFGNWQQGYVINDRAGLKTLRDPYTNKPFVSFYCTKRVGGGVKDPRALRVQRIAAS